MHSRFPLRWLVSLKDTPDVIGSIISGIVNKHILVNYDYYFKKGSSSRLKQVSMKITNVCNLRCKMCGQWGEKGYNWGKPTTEIRETVPVETYKKMIDDVKRYKPIYYIWGGEPFLYPGILDVLKHLKKNKMTTSIVTNGVKLRDTAKELVEMGLDALMVSLDGPKEVHNEIRGDNKCFDTLIEGVKEVNRIKKELKKKKPHIMILSTISNDNINHLDEIFEEAKKMHADIVIVYYSWFTTEEIGRRHEKILKDSLGCTPVAWKGYLHSFDKIDVEKLQQKVRKIQNTKYPFPHLFIPDLKIEEIKEYYEKPSSMFGYGRCVSPWLTAEVMPNGDVAFCRDYPDFVIGNINEDSLPTIFNSERAKKFRETLKEKGGLFPICARCCGLMGW